MRIFIKNTEGEPSASLTMVMVSFLIVSSWLVLWIVASAFHIPIPPFDATSAMAYLTPQLGLYFGRRYTSKTDATSKTVETSIDGFSPGPDNSK
jgi:hypothetical protein